MASAKEKAAELVKKYPESLSRSVDDEGQVWLWGHFEAEHRASYRECRELFGSPETDDGYPVWPVRGAGEG